MADTLYETIGGRLRIQAAVDLFYVKVFADPNVRHFFEGVDVQGLHARQSMFVSMLLGGKIVYTGKDIGKAHANARVQGMNDAHFNILLLHFRSALEEIGVQTDKIVKIMALLEGTRDVVLGRTSKKDD
ncbi:MAG: group 1 truncated hemoglobin [Acidobacteria bacterium]|nr:group 1 truncated hemoglobin [Acidobacteriota bacterium]MCL5287917.1 group 1 truncated hemoglobin [Acidobacteriota bacterium]